MLSQGDLLYIQRPTQNQQRVLIPLDIVANEQDQIIIEQVAFYQAILGIEPASPSFKDGLEVMKVCNAIRQSYQTQSWTLV